MKVLAAVAFIVVPLLVACSGSTDGGQSGGSAGGTVTRLAPGDFRLAVSDGKAFVVNVHVPYEGEIASTSAFVPYDRVRSSTSKLPADKSTPVYVYCRSGMMSAEASEVLLDMGYERVFDLAGGMVAWRAAGFDVIQVPGRD